MKVVVLEEYKHEKMEKEFSKIEQAFIEGKQFDINAALDKVRKKYDNTKEQ